MPRPRLNNQWGIKLNHEGLIMEEFFREGLVSRSFISLRVYFPLELDWGLISIAIFLTPRKTHGKELY